MYYLSENEAENWRRAAARAAAGEAPDEVIAGTSEWLEPALCYFLGVTSLRRGDDGRAIEWLSRGAEIEPVRASAYLLDYLGRNEGRLVAPQPSFTDPRPWAHFSSLPHLQSARQRLVEFCAGSMPSFDHDIRYVDVGCGNGQLSVVLIEALIEAGKVPGVAQVLALDPSREMVSTARENMCEAFPSAEIIGVESVLEGVTASFDDRYDLALCALSVHHMPCELKAAHVGALMVATDNLVVFELGANHDIPEMDSPELIYSVYQTFGQSLEYIFAREAPGEVQRSCADIFVMSETVSLLTMPRGERTEYHMMRDQWHELLGEICPAGMSRLGERTCYADEYCELFALHYGR